MTTDEPTDDQTATSARARGQAQMRAVYGWDIEPTKPFEVATVDHLFGEVWAAGDLTVKERRLLLIGLAVGIGMTDVATLQLDSALNLDELSAEDLRTIVVFLAHYAGWPRAAALNSQVEELIARRERAAAKAAQSNA
jgi:4-carboxymuconolactone decarboxylase